MRRNLLARLLQFADVVCLFNFERSYSYTYGSGIALCMQSKNLQSATFGTLLRCFHVGS